MLADFRLGKANTKEAVQSKLLFRKRMFRETDESITEPMFINLSYVQAQHDYLQVGAVEYAVRHSCGGLSHWARTSAERCSWGYLLMLTSQQDERKPYELQQRSLRRARPATLTHGI